MSFFDMIQSFDTSVLEFIQNTFKCSFLDPIMAFFSYIGEMGLFWIAISVIMTTGIVSYILSLIQQNSRIS